MISNKRKINPNSNTFQAKGVIQDSSINQKSTQADESLMNTDYMSHCDYRSSQLSNTNRDNQLSSSRKKEHDFTLKKDSMNELESLISLLDESVIKKMNNDKKKHKTIYKAKSKDLDRLETSICTTQQSLDQSIQNVHSLYQENNKLYYEKILVETENKHEINEYEDTIKMNERMDKEIIHLDALSRKMKTETICRKHDLIMASKNCKEISSFIANTIEENKSLTSGIILTQLKISKIKEVLLKCNMKERSITEHIKSLIEKYS